MGTATGDARGQKLAHKRLWFWSGGLVLAIVAGVVLASMGSGEAQAPPATSGPAPLQPAVSGPALPVVEVYKDPACGCCSLWMAHLRDHGFTVLTATSTDVAAVKTRHGVPPEVYSCHTAIVDGYIVEGHVPADDIRRLLAERPQVAGIAVPGMPIGSPGMEMPGTVSEPYDVLAFDQAGNTQVFARH
jgi:hypothetical protein